ncbi:MAG: hypothetical protein R2748_11750 [Bryobacterales bacterium]
MDSCPFDATDSCGPLDFDGDGTPNIVDPCPADATNSCVVSAGPGTIRTFAGGGPVDGLPALAAPLGLPMSVAVGSEGNLYIAAGELDRSCA